MQDMLRKMGVRNQEIDALEVIIMQKDGKKLVIKNPKVMEVEFSGQRTFQIVGDISMQEGKGKAGSSGHGALGTGQQEEVIEVSDKDVKFVADTAMMPEKKARETLIKTRGDIAKAILILKK